MNSLAVQSGKIEMALHARGGATTASTNGTPMEPPAEVRRAAPVEHLGTASPVVVRRYVRRQSSPLRSSSPQRAGVVGQLISTVPVPTMSRPVRVVREQPLSVREALPRAISPQRERPATVREG